MTSEKRRKDAEIQHALLSDRESDQPSGKVRRKITVPGGNPTLPVAEVLISPNGTEFWKEDMPSYVLGILDETVTNGYRIDGARLELLSSGTDLAKTRLRYAALALQKAGATASKI